MADEYKKRLADIKTWLIRIYSVRFVSAGFDRFGNVLFWVVFAILAVGALWYCGAFFHAFDVSPFVAWIVVSVLPGLLTASLFFWRLLAIAALLELTVFVWFYSITPQERFSGTVWQQPWQRKFQVRRLRKR